MKAKSWTQMTKCLKILKLYNWFVPTDFLEQYIVIVSANPTCRFRLHKHSMYENLIQALDASQNYIIGENTEPKKDKWSDMYWQGYYIFALSRHEFIQY